MNADIGRSIAFENNYAIFHVLPKIITNIAFVAAIFGGLLVVMSRDWLRIALLIPTLYLGILVWENRLVFEPSLTRQFVFGALLVVMMAARPQGLLGKRRVEIT